MRPSFFWHALFAGIRPKELVQGPAHEEHDYPERRRGQDRRLLDCFDPLPPARSRTAAKAAIAAPQASLSVTLGSFAAGGHAAQHDGPRVRAGDEEGREKKIVTSDVMTGSGYSWRKTKRPTAGSLLAAALIVPPKDWSRSMAAAPNTANHRKVPTLGAIKTPKTNSRMVRPREIRAINAPTNGAQAIHVAKWNMVNLPRNAVFASKAFILKLMGISSPR